MLAALRGFGRFWFDFIVGDDWRIAVGVAVTVVVGGVLLHERIVRSELVAVGVAVAVIVFVVAAILDDGRRLRSR